ncbi:LacI family DNA-binding transcriptional regulator [Kushneria sp. TE3]|uniref:LacI family DNA-binding transcriptional regulator n=1 Tax=Kushneria sp. TE3 TaxID=3449832 RepID=UPI003F689340
MTRRPTLKHIAERVGVTASTVSLALRDDARISTAMRERVRQVAQEVGYIYNRHAAGLRRGDSGTVALCLNDLGNPFFTEFIAAMEQRFRAEERMMLFCHAQESLAVQADFMRRMAEHGASGLILIPAAGTTLEDLPGAEASHLRHLPLVLLSRDVDGVEVDRVINDDARGMAMVVEHLLSLGHQRIAWLGGGNMTSTARDREQAFREMLTQAGYPPDQDGICHGPTTMAFGHQGLEALMAQPRPPTAVVCFSDLIAFGAVAACHGLGLRPGVDISIAGFDDMSAAAYTTPPLTSVRVRTDLMGARASEMLLARIRGDHEAPRREIMPPELVVRETTGPVSSRNQD